MRIQLLSVLIFSALASNASAQEAHNLLEATTAIKAHASIYGPVGVTGFSVEYAPIPQVVLLGGVGVTTTLDFNGPGWRGSLGVRARALLGQRSALGVEQWLSTGPHRAVLLDVDYTGPEYGWDLALFSRTALSYEFVSARGLSLGGYAGYAVLLGGRETDGPGYSSWSQSDEPRPMGPFFGLTFGHTFGVTRPQHE